MGRKTFAKDRPDRLASQSGLTLEVVNLYTVASKIRRFNAHIVMPEFYGIEASTRLWRLGRSDHVTKRVDDVATPSKKWLLYLVDIDICMATLPCRGMTSKLCRIR